MALVRTPTLDDLQQRLRHLERRCWPVRGLRGRAPSAAPFAHALQASLKNQARDLARQTNPIPDGRPAPLASHRDQVASDADRIDALHDRTRQLQAQIDAVVVAVDARQPQPGRDSAERFARDVARLERRLHRAQLMLSATRGQNDARRRQLEADRRDLETALGQIDGLNAGLGRTRARLVRALDHESAQLDARNRRAARLAQLGAAAGAELAQFQRQWAILSQMLIDLDEGRLVPRPEPPPAFVDESEAVQIRAIADIKARALWAMATDTACGAVAERQLRDERARVEAVLAGTGVADPDALADVLERRQRCCDQQLRELWRLQQWLRETAGVDASPWRTPSPTPSSSLPPATDPIAVVQAELADTDRTLTRLGVEFAAVLDRVQAMAALFGAEFQGPIKVCDRNLDQVLDALERHVFALLDAGTGPDIRPLRDDDDAVFDADDNQATSVMALPTTSV